MNNIIPSLRSAGKFVAEAPFNQVVDESRFYTVEAIRTIPEMQALKLDLFKLVFEPVGFSQEDYQIQVQTAIDNKAAVISLTSRGKGPVYVLSTFLKSFPVIDGVVYEHIALITSLGACPPSMKEKIDNAIEHINNYIKGSFGIDNPNTTIGTIPTRGYVSREDAVAWENSRQLAIIDEPSDAVKIAKLEKENIELKAYIAELEATIINNS
ncbi:putative virion structural protein [Aeromonas phage ZPAH34]|uniref:putative virion structural protein n=1 Tax=Aeromonas phage ZPAH34 TaxID=2924888 RepID=UPI00232941EA|nr:putative virion structural protein [Aeromonas phage ZPAH34]UOX39498.1 putative virion structural protein [Aeromonas phage ZPAH34]